MSDERGAEAVEGDCTLPPDQPLPADQLGRYSPERDYNAERKIADYVEPRLTMMTRLCNTPSV
jgi:hypothetical protein